MKTISNFPKILLLCLLAGSPFAVHSQITHWPTVFIVSSGNYGVPGNKVKLYARAFNEDSISLVDSMDGNYTNAAAVYPAALTYGKVFFNVDSVLYRYNFLRKEKEDSITIPVSKLACTLDYLAVLSGYPATSNFLHIYDVNTTGRMKLVYTDTSLHAPKALKVIKDTLYVVDDQGKNGSFYIYSLSSYPTPSLIRKIDFEYRDSVKDLSSIVFDKNFIYAVSDRYASAHGVYILDTLKDTVTFIKADINTALSAIDGEIYANSGGGFDDYSTKTMLSTKLNTIDYHDGVYDSLFERFYLIKGDFFNPDSVFVVDLSGKIIRKQKIGASSKAIAMTYYSPESIPESLPSHSLLVYPNPASGNLYIDTKGAKTGLLSVRDMTGKLIYSKTLNTSGGPLNLNVSAYPQGIYLLSLQNGQQQLNTRFIKE